jgi:hypothetical protein
MKRGPSKSALAIVSFRTISALTLGILWIYELFDHPGIAFPPLATAAFTFVVWQFYSYYLNFFNIVIGTAIVSLVFCLVTAALTGGSPWWFFGTILPCFLAVAPIGMDMIEEARANSPERNEPNFFIRWALSIDEEREHRRRLKQSRTASRK